MTRPKKGAKKGEKLPDERVAIIHLKGTAEYAAWLDGFHRQTHIPKATLVRLGMMLLAKQHGYPDPPEF